MTSSVKDPSVTVACAPISLSVSDALLHVKLVPVESYCKKSPSAAATSASKSGSTINPSVMAVAVPIPKSAALCHSKSPVVDSYVNISSSDALSTAFKSPSTIVSSVKAPSVIVTVVPNVVTP